MAVTPGLHTWSMETQLQLVDHHDPNPVDTRATRATRRTSSPAEAASDTERPATRPDWRIDDASKARGRAGIALARAALAQARQGRPITSDQRADHTTAA